MAAVAALGTSSAWAQSRPAKPTTVIDVKKMGAFGNGKLPDARQIKAAIAAAADEPRGAIVYFPPGEYFLGAADDNWLIPAVNLNNVHFVGERATLTCKSVNGSSSMLAFGACRNVSVQGLRFRDHALDREKLIGAAGIRLANEGRRGCEDVEIRDCTFESVIAGVVCRSFDETKTARIRGVTLTNLSVSHSLYGFNFQDAGDNVTGRGLRCVDCKRSYFPYGVSRHDIELESSGNATGFTDVIISCYTKDTTDIRLKLKVRGKGPGDAVINLDHNNEVPDRVLRNVRIDADIEAPDCRLETAILFRSRDKGRRVEATTTRRWEAISLDGDIRICDKTKLFEWESVSKTPGALFIGPRLAKHPRLPRTFPGFNATIAQG